MKKTYLGDSVYVELTEFGEVKLTTDNGPGFKTNAIVLEPEVLRNFDLWREHLKNVLES